MIDRQTGNPLPQHTFRQGRVCDICKCELTQFCGNKGNDFLLLKLVEVEAILEDLQREAFVGIGMGR